MTSFNHDPTGSACNETVQDIRRSDADILKHGSTQEVRALIGRLWGNLIRHAELILNDKQRAEDVVQEALIRALANIDTFEERHSASLEAWIRRIVVNQAISTVRSVTRRREESLDTIQSTMDNGVRIAEASILTQLSAEDIAANAQIRDRVMEGIMTLAEPLRLTLYLRDVEGYSTRETAQLLDTTEGNVRARLHRARLALKTKLDHLLTDIKS